MKMVRWEIRTATIAAYESGVSSHFKVEMLQQYAELRQNLCGEHAVQVQTIILSRSLA